MNQTKTDFIDFILLNAQLSLSYGYDAHLDAHLDGQTATQNSDTRHRPASRTPRTPRRSAPWSHGTFRKLDGHLSRRGEERKERASLKIFISRTADGGSNEALMTMSQVVIADSLISIS